MSWITSVYWFDLSLYLGLLVLGTICFGHFESWKPRWRRVLKVVLFTAIFAGLLQLGGRPLAWGFLGSMLLLVLYVHAVWLPKHGINGWSGEPREKYLALVTRRR